MRFASGLACALSWLVAWGAAAQAGPLREFVEPGTTLTPAAPPPIGACLGGSCGARPPAQARELLRARDGLAFGAGVLGTVSAGLVLGGAIAIAAAHDLDSERITRGVWLGYFAVATPAVAFMAYLARKDHSFKGYRGLRRFGWAAYALSVTDGVLFWYGAFHSYDTPRALTIGGGAIGALALLAHAFDAFMGARAARTHFLVRAAPMGLAVRF